jgi:hypothetical protein
MGIHVNEVQRRVRRVLVIAAQFLAAPFSSAELLRLLSREHPAQAAFEIELFHVEDEPRIVRAGGASEKNPPQIRALGFVRSHRCVGCAVTIRTPRKASDEAVVRFAYLAPERDRTTPFEG